jgi:hypothetical protein
MSVGIVGPDADNLTECGGRLVAIVPAELEVGLHDQLGVHQQRNSWVSFCDGNLRPFNFEALIIWPPLNKRRRVSKIAMIFILPDTT